MRGLNFGGWFSQIDAIEEKDPARFPGVDQHLRTFLGRSDMEQVAAWGFDHVRLPVDWQVVFDDKLRPREAVMDLLVQAVADLRQCGLEVILDLHRCPGHDFHDGCTRDQAFFTDASLRADCLRVWEQLAERLGNQPGVLLELLNEPVAPSSALWNEVKDELVKNLRRMAPRSTLVVGSNLWNNASTFADLTPVEDDNILYSVHLYTPVVFTHQAAPWIADEMFRERRSYPGNYDIPEDQSARLPVDRGPWDRARMAAYLEPVFRFRQEHGVEVACNEFGVYMGGADRQSRWNWMSDVLGLFSENNVGWSYWNYKNLDFGVKSIGEGLFQAAPQYDNPDRTDFELLDLLRKS